jgi:carboxymethylenebutenolidase
MSNACLGAALGLMTISNGLALVPNPFYRTAKAPVFDNPASFNFDNPEDRAKLIDKTKKIGTQGYCMGGSLVVRTAAAVADRIGAGASFHGGGLVTDNPNSPHLLAPKIKERMYFGIAANDDMRQPDAKDKLKAAFAAAKVPAEIELYGSLHGWCVPDMPLQNGKPIYDMTDAERAWGKLVTLYRAALA